MRGFEVSRNGVRLCVAAAKNDESLTVAMCAYAREEFLDVAGSLGPGDSL